MQSLMAFYEAIIALYAYQLEMGIALTQWNAFLKSNINGQTSLENHIFLGRGDPTRHDAKFDVKKTYRQLIQDSGVDGLNSRLHRNAVVALTYSLWEVEHRQLIATECGFDKKNDIESVVFQDLNKYRQAILHVSGILDREPEVIRYFRKGEVVAFTSDQMHDLFSSLVEELNRIGKTYYNQDPRLTLEKPMHPNHG